MIRARYRWEWKLPDEQLVRQWAAHLQVPLLAARVLVSRGWTLEEAAALIRPADEAGLTDPLQMKGMAEAAARIERAVREQERIRVYGDYDADGVTSTALMTRLFSRLGAVFDTYIPHRSLEGYGLNRNAIDLAVDAGVSLIVTVDNGISAVEPIAYARARGIDVVVTDHHEPPAVLPEAVALVNPKQPGCPYPFKGLCGAGVAFKLAHVLLGRPATEWADLAAIGTIADLMPLVGENRIIVRMGLERMRREPSAGIRALAAVCGTEPAELTSGRIGFGLAPRLNAGGRLERADGAVRLLTTDDEEEATALARELDKLNGERQKLVDSTVEEAERLWQEKKAAYGGSGPNVIVLSGAGWNAGIAGLVASKMVERHYRPAIVLAADPVNGKCKGSARSIDGFDLFAALSECASCLDHFGGHQAAAGMTLDLTRVGELEDRLHRVAEQRLQPEDWLPKKRADIACTLEDTTLTAAESLAGLEPYGNGHPTPRILLQGMRVTESRTLGKEGKHLRLTIEQGGRTLEAVGFGWGELAGRLAEGRKIDLLGELTVNEWKGSRRVQLSLQDLKSDEPLWFDRRKGSGLWREVEKLAAERDTDLVVVCASASLAGEAAARDGLREATVLTYDNAAAYVAGQTAAATETGPGSGNSAGRHLALVGLPDHEPGIAQLSGWFADDAGWDSVFLFAAGGAAEPRAVLERSQFAQVYALFREEGSWIDGPEGFLRRTAERTQLSLAAIRLVQEVFEELGFIRVRGAECAIVSDPPRRKLDESNRYKRMKSQAEAAAFPQWPVDRLKEWAASCRSSG